MSYRNDFEAAKSLSNFAANSLLGRWLQSDLHRPRLYEELRNSRNSILEFTSCASTGERPDVVTQRTAYLLTEASHIEQALENFSNAPYKALGSGTVVLASDNNEIDQHEAKRKIVSNALSLGSTTAEFKRNISSVIGIACHHAVVLARKKDDFDFVADVAEPAALFFVEGLYGIEFAHHPELVAAMRLMYDGMAYQMLARHFENAPAVPVKGDQGGAMLLKILADALEEQRNPKLLTRISELLSDSRQAVSTALKTLLPVLKKQESRVGGELFTAAKNSLDTDENIPFHINQLIDHALNFHKVRLWIENELTSDLLLGDTDSHESGAESVRELVDLLKEQKKLKEAPDDHLIPMRISKPNKKNYIYRETVLGRLAKNPELVSADGLSLSSTGILTEIAGSIAGIVGNFIASSSIAIRTIIEQDKVGHFKGIPVGSAPSAKCSRLIMEALRLDPPAPFLPRQTCNDKDGIKAKASAKAKAKAKTKRTFTMNGGRKKVLNEDTDVLLPLGSLTRAATTSKNPEQFDESRKMDNLIVAYNYIFGQQEPRDDTSHRCTGDYMALGFINTLLGNVLSLHNIAIKEQDSSDQALQKKWGFVCEKLQLVHKHEEGLKQQPLNVVMKIKTPIATHAEILKKVVAYGAPVVEHLLENSNVVHFARFVILNNDTELALFTTYDGGFDEYLEYFAEQAGPLFDMIFQHIQDAPPMPVRDNVQAFTTHIKRFDVPSLSGYFYSAYPTASVAEISKLLEFSKLFTGPEITKRINAAKEEAENE